jgi:hypothetical protein
MRKVKQNSKKYTVNIIFVFVVALSALLFHSTVAQGIESATKLNFSVPEERVWVVPISGKSASRRRSTPEGIKSVTKDI